MATVTFKEGNGGVHRYTNFQDYSVASITNNKILLEYNFNRGPFDPARSPWMVEIVFRDAEYHTVETGPDAGETVFSGGTITRVDFFSITGDLQVRINDIAAPLAFVQNLYDADNLHRFYDFLVAGGSTFKGSSDPDPEEWDDIATGTGDDVIIAGAGDDYIKDRGGSDTYRGGAGDFDTVSYDEWFWNPIGAFSGIVGDLRNGTVTGPDGEVDALFGIENLRGTFFDDTMFGDKKDNRLMGMAGDDFLNGRGGFDIAEYRNDDDQGGMDGIVASMKTKTVRDGFGNTDTLQSIEGIVGTDFDDLFNDWKGNNYYDGRDGDDEFRLRQGDDVVRGREGADTFIFFGNFGNDQIRDFDFGEGDRIDIRAAADFGDLTIGNNGNGEAEISINGNSVLLNGYDESQVLEDFFLF